MVEKIILKKHIQCKMHKKDIIENSSDLVECAENQVDKNSNETNISEMFTLQEVVIRAETIQVLKVVDSNYSFFF